jgi:hypothetical protein
MSPGISPGADVGRHPSARFAGSRLAVTPMTVWMLHCVCCAVPVSHRLCDPDVGSADIPSCNSCGSWSQLGLNGDRWFRQLMFMWSVWCRHRIP